MTSNKPWLASTTNAQTVTPQLLPKSNNQQCKNIHIMQTDDCYRYRKEKWCTVKYAVEIFLCNSAGSEESTGTQFYKVTR